MFGVNNFLIEYYKSFEEFSDEEAEFYNEAIEEFENGSLKNVHKLSFDDLKKRMVDLKKEIEDQRTPMPPNMPLIKTRT